METSSTRKKSIPIILLLTASYCVCAKQKNFQTDFIIRCDCICRLFISIFYFLFVMSMNINVHDKLTIPQCYRNGLCDPEKARADEIKRRKILRLAQVINCFEKSAGFFHNLIAGTPTVECFCGGKTT